jgi:CubicO group peptidase (beta-lactamase class C family)
LVILLILLPVVLLGTVIARILLVPVIAPDSYDALRSHLDRELPALMERHGVPGAAMTLVHDGDVWVQGYGSADTGTGRRVAADTVFQAASVSKSVSAWGVMRLVEQGEFGLDVPVSRYLTRWRLPPSAFDPEGVTVRRFLSHTAGLSVGGYLGYDPAVALPSLETELSVGGDAAGPDGAVRVVYPPGEEVHYSGGGYTLLQLLVEEVSGRSFAEYMGQQVLAPLGMTQSTFEWSPGVREAIATPYRTDGTVLPQFRFAAKAAGGLYTTAPDLARFVAATMGGRGAPRGGGVLAPGTLDLMLSSAPGATITMGPLRVGANGLGYAIHPILLGGGASSSGTMAAIRAGRRRSWPCRPNGRAWSS